MALEDNIPLIASSHRLKNQRIYVLYMIDQINYNSGTHIFRK